MSRQKTTYSIAGELGRGGFGVVYLLKGDNGHKLALKTVDLRKLPDEYRARATDEAKILHSLSHKHLVHHVNSYIKHPYLCIITEFCGGGDMEKITSHLGFSSGLPEKLLVCWLMQAASALNYMHTHNPVVLHRDLKPQNIYVTETGNLRVGDLGLARKLAGPADFATSQVGTILYLSPEILAHQPYNSKKLPLPDSYSEGLRSIITRMLTKDPRHRPSAGNIMSSAVVQEFERNPQTPMEIVSEAARRQGRRPPQFARDLSKLKGAYSAPLKTDDILVPADVEQTLSDIDRKHEGYRLGSGSPPPTRARPPANTKHNPAHTVTGMSSNSMILFGGAGAVGAGGGGGQAILGATGGSDGSETASGGSDLDDETFYDSQNQPEMGEEHLLLQIQQCQNECTQGLGADVLEAAYGVIANVRDVSALKKQLMELLGSTLYKGYGARILRLRALEYGLHKTTQRHTRQIWN